MNEKDLIADLIEIHKLTRNCKDPALIADQHDAITKVMSIAVARVKLSYQLEKEKKEREEADKKEIAKQNEEKIEE